MFLGDKISLANRRALKYYNIVANKKTKDPKIPATVSIPRNLLRTARAVAKAQKTPFSQWITGLIREYFQNVEKVLR